MAKFYGTKIKNGVINPKTNLPWVIADVPKLWREATAQWLEDNQN